MASRWRLKSNIQSMSIGGHPYESFVNFWATNENAGRRMYRPSNPPAMPYEPDHYSEDVESTHQVCRKLQYLRLPIRFQDGILPCIRPEIDTGMSDNFVGKIMAFSALELVRLSLSALDLLGASYDKGVCIKASRDCLDSLFFPMTFTALQRLKLCGWPLSGQSFWGFLSKHSSTLKELCLTECIFGRPK